MSYFFVGVRGLHIARMGSTMQSKVFRWDLVNVGVGQAGFSNVCAYSRTSAIGVLHLWFGLLDMACCVDWRHVICFFTWSA